jgi:hypothetical protein
MIETLTALAVAGLAYGGEWLIRYVVATVKMWLTLRAEREPKPARVKVPRMPKVKQPSKPAGGRFMAYLLLAGGTLATVAANYAHAHENIGAKLLSAVVPMLLFIAFHVAAADGRWWIRVSTGVVALVCFAISFDHIMHLAGSYGESDLSAVLYPLAIDGAMIVGTFVLSRTADRTAAALSAPAPVSVPKPVRPAVRAPEPVLSAVPPVLSEDKPRTNGFVRPMPPRTEKPVPKDNDARLSAATRIAKELGDKLSRETLVKALKEEGYKISTNEAAALTRQLKAARS